MKLRTKLSIIFVILQVLIISGMGISLYLTVRDSIRNQINNDLEDKITLLSRIIETYFNINDEYVNENQISYIESDRLYLKKQLDITIGDTGYTYVLNREGYMIIHPNLEDYYVMMKMNNG